MPIIDQKSSRKISQLEFIAKQVVEGFLTGLHKSPFHGFSVEFAEHRLYNKGESIKHIDWKLYGKTDKLFVKRFEEETNLRCQLVIDTSSSMLFPSVKNKGLLDFVNKSGLNEGDGTINKLRYSVYCCAALIELFKRQRDAFGLSAFSDKVELSLLPKSSVMHKQLIYHELERLLSKDDTGTKTNAAAAIHQIAETINKRSLIIIFSDMLDNSMDGDVENNAVFSALQHLKHKKHEVVLFHVYDKQKEVNFNYDNKPYRFVDIESEEEVKLHPNEVKEVYQEAIQNYYKLLQLKCLQYKIDFVDVDINEPFDKVLSAYLMKRKNIT